MSDTDAARVRALVRLIVDAGPPPPSFDDVVADAHAHDDDDASAREHAQRSPVASPVAHRRRWRPRTTVFAAVALVVLAAVTSVALVVTRSGGGDSAVDSVGTAGRRSQSVPPNDAADGTCHLASRDKERVLQWGNSPDQELVVTTTPTNYELDVFTDDQNAHGSVLDPRAWNQFADGTKVSWVETLTADAVVLYGAAPTGTTSIILGPGDRAAGSVVRDTKPVIVDKRCGFTVFAVAFSPTVALESATAVDATGHVLATAALREVGPGKFGGAVLPVSLTPGASMLRTPGDTSGSSTTPTSPIGTPIAGGVACVPREVIDSFNADGLPPLESVITSEEQIRSRAQTYAAQIRSRYPGVVDIAIGRGYGRAWTRNGETVKVVSVDDLAIIVTVAEPDQCPPTPDGSAAINGTTMFFRHL